MPIVVGDFFHIILASTTHFDNFSGLSENDGASPIQIDMDSPGRYVPNASEGLYNAVS